jgi:biopolymer transport protein ExbD
VASKRKRKVESPPVDVTLPITPMLDMSFQLLSFFILTFHPMPVEGQLSVNLPKVDAADKAEVDPSTLEDQKDEYTVTVIANSTGEIANLGLKGPAADLGNIKNLAELLDQLKKIAKSTQKGAAGIAVTIEASPDLLYARLIELMDLCKRAGYESVNLMPIGRGK